MKVFWTFLVSCALLLRSLASTEGQQEASTGIALTQTGQSSNVLLVTLLDGHVVALDHTTGRTLWTFDSGAPLVSAKQSLASSQGLNVFPGTDGGLFAYNGMKHLNPALERLPISLPELVESAPSLTADGSVILGKRESKVFLVDRHTGRSITTLSNAAEALEDHTGSFGLSAVLAQGDVLFLGRQDYVVRSVRTDTKAFDSESMLRKWYIAFDTPPVAAFRQDGLGGNCLDPEQAAGGRARAASSRGLLPGSLHSGSTQLPGHKLKGKLAGGTTVLVGALKGSLYALPADNLMLAVDDDSSDNAAASTAAVVWPRRVGHLPLDIAPAGSDYCKAAGIAGSERSGQPAIGADPSPPAAGGDTSAGTAQRKPQQLPGSSAGATCSAPGSGSSGQCNAAGGDGGSAGDGSAGRALAVVDDSTSSKSLVPLQPSDASVVEEMGSLTCPRPPLGIHSISAQEGQTVVSWLPGGSPPVQQAAQEATVALAAPPAPQVEPINGAVGSGKKGKSKHKSTRHKAACPGSSVLPSAAADDEAHVTATVATAGPLYAPPPSPSPSGGGSENGIMAHPASMGGSWPGSPVLSSSRPSSLPPSLAPSPLPTAAHWLSNGSMSPSPAGPAGVDVGAMSPVSLDGSVVGGGLASAGGVSAGGGMEGGVLASRSYVDEDGAVVIGRLRVGPGILGYGSAGTIVYEGFLDSRPVAVKRLLRQFYNLARKEIQVLVVSDEHPNVVRCFAMEEDREFVYLALERCRHSLSNTLGSKEGQEAMQDPVTGCPTPWCLAVLADIAAGLAALHERQIVHRDLKPHNVLLTEAGRAKLSDMGLSKQLVSEQSSFESHGSGGSSGWQAPEQLMAKDGISVRQSRAVDVFSFGCIVYYCITGDWQMPGCPLGGLLVFPRWPEALNLVAAMLQKSPGARPTMSAVLSHPFWWSDEQKLQFLVDVSDRVENEDRDPDPTLLNALESFTVAAVGPNWGAHIDAELIANLGKYRRYDYTCLRDLLRVVRNKRNHFREMPENLQQLMGPVPEGYYRYFSSRFPTLLLGGEEVLHMAAFPSRPGKQLCDFYSKTGHCKYGSDCVYDHPAEYAVQLTEEGLPFRPGEPVCTFYYKTMQCKFGPSCKFHHPKLVPIYAGSAIQQHQ
eukprot:gene13052-13179_t